MKSIFLNTGGFDGPAGNVFKVRSEAGRMVQRKSYQIHSKIS